MVNMSIGHLWNFLLIIKRKYDSSVSILDAEALKSIYQVYEIYNKHPA